MGTECGRTRNPHRGLLGAGWRRGALSWFGRLRGQGFRKLMLGSTPSPPKVPKEAMAVGGGDLGGGSCKPPALLCPTPPPWALPNLAFYGEEVGPSGPGCRGRGRGLRGLLESSSRRAAHSMLWGSSLSLVWYSPGTRETLSGSHVRHCGLGRPDNSHHPMPSASSLQAQPRPHGPASPGPGLHLTSWRPSGELTWGPQAVTYLRCLEGPSPSSHLLDPGPGTVAGSVL